MIRIIPAIDIINGKVVRLRMGDFDQSTEYARDPLSVASQYEQAGIKYLHLVDLDGARAGHIVNDEVLRQIANKTSLIIDFGGGLRSDADIARAFDCGAHQVTVGSVAVKDPTRVNTWIEKYSPQKLILGADVVDQKIAISAWQDTTSLDIFEFIDSYQDSGINSCICTDVSRDGLMTGPATQLYMDIKKRFPQLFLIASGGVSDFDDVRQLDTAGIDGVIIGKALLEQKIELDQLSEFLC